MYPAGKKGLPELGLPNSRLTYYRRGFMGSKCQILGLDGKPIAVPGLIKELQCNILHIRYNSSLVIGKCGDARAISPLVKTLKNDPNYLVRRNAASALVQIWVRLNLQKKDDHDTALSALMLKLHKRVIAGFSSALDDKRADVPEDGLLEECRMGLMNDESKDSAIIIGKIAQKVHVISQNGEKRLKRLNEYIALSFSRLKEINPPSSKDVRTNFSIGKTGISKNLKLLQY